jgi:hypothetical protein
MIIEEVVTNLSIFFIIIVLLAILNIIINIDWSIIKWYFIWLYNKYKTDLGRFVTKYKPFLDGFALKYKKYILGFLWLIRYWRLGVIFIPIIYVISYNIWNCYIGGNLWGIITKELNDCIYIGFFFYISNKIRSTKFIKNLPIISYLIIILIILIIGFLVKGLTLYSINFIITIVISYYNIFFFKRKKKKNSITIFFFFLRLEKKNAVPLSSTKYYYITNYYIYDFKG